MQIVSISDLHIKEANDEAAKLFLSFCNHPKTLSSDRVYLLGDIFEFLVGDHYAYTRKYKFFFEAIVELLDAGKEVVFMEGNHDFHFKQITLKYLKKHTGNWNNFRYEKHGEILKISDKKYFICHGYEVDYFNHYFKNWYDIYTSKWMYILTTYILPYILITYLGNMASKDSKRRGKKTFNFEKMKKKYLDGAKELLQEKNVDVIISGHTHIKESHLYDSGKSYFNNGFPLKHKSFVYLNNNTVELVELQ